LKFVFWEFGISISSGAFFDTKRHYKNYKLSKMKNIIKTLLLVFALTSFVTMGCQNAADSTDPVISNFTVNGAAANAGRYDHELGSDIKFNMNISDAKGLDEFQVVSDQGIYTEDLEGTADAVEYTFTVNADTYTEGDSIQLEFKAFDVSGNTGLLPYRIFVVQ